MLVILILVAILAVFRFAASTAYAIVRLVGFFVYAPRVRLSALC